MRSQFNKIKVAAIRVVEADSYQFSRFPNGLGNDFKKQRDIESVMLVDTDSE